MIIIKVLPEHLYIMGSSNFNLILSPIKNNALKFDEPKNYNIDYIKVNNRELYYYMSLVKSIGKRAELEDYE